MAPPLERVFLAGPSTGFANPILAAPWVFTGEDNLRVVILNSQPGVVVSLDGRFVEEKAPGTASPLSERFTPTADRLPSTFDVPLGVGFLLNISVVVTSGAPLIGQTYVMVQVIRGLSGATVVLGCLLGGYVTAMQHLAYPGSPIQSSTDGEPFVRLITGADPAPGVECSETVPAGARWELLTFLVTVQTAAPGGVRVGTLAFASGAVVYAQFPSVTNIAPATSKSITWAKGMPQGAVSTGSRPSGGLSTQPLLLAGHKIQTILDGADPGDDYGAPIYSVREWLEVA